MSEGRAILFSSHVLGEVVRVSDRLLVIHRGRLLLDSGLAELRERASEQGQDLEQTVLDIIRKAETPQSVRA